MENTYCVYIHTAPNGKMYIGQTSQKPEARWNNGRGYCRRIKGKYAQPLMARAVHKIPWEYWEHEVVYEGLTAEEANIYEEWLIYLAWSDNPEYGYNIRKGGSNSGLSEETKKKIGDANRGKKISEEQKSRLREANTGKKASEETKRKLSKIHKNKPLSEEHKKKISEKRKGIVFSDETLIKMSNAQKGEKSHRAKSVQCVETGEILWGATAFKEKYGFDTGHINSCCRGKLKTAYGYHWKYAKEVS